MEILKRLGLFALARAQERSSVAGAITVGMTLLGIVLPADTVGAIVSAVVAVAGVVAMVVPGGK